MSSMEVIVSMLDNGCYGQMGLVLAVLPFSRTLIPKKFSFLLGMMRNQPPSGMTTSDHVPATPPPLTTQKPLEAHAAAFAGRAPPA